MAEKKSQIGTGYGREPYAQYTRFERASDTPNETIAIYYDSYENLLAQGVSGRQDADREIAARAVPDGGHFAPPPRSPTVPDAGWGATLATA
jgi:hypothetical protein